MATNDLRERKHELGGGDPDLELKKLSDTEGPGGQGEATGTSGQGEASVPED